MTSVYEVKTKHTEQVLKDFLTFKEAAKHIHMTFRLVMIGICGITLAIMGKGGTMTYIFSVLAAIILCFAAVRKKLAFNGLSKKDLNYQSQCEIEFTFGQGEFRVNNPDNGGEQRLRYGEITYIYQDEKYYYISVNNEDLHMLPRADFTMGNAENFGKFLEGRTDKTLQPVKIPWKTKFAILKQALIEKRADADRKRAEAEKKKK